MADNFVFGIGEEVRDTVTGFKGNIMARVQYLTGCNQYHVAPTKLAKDGSIAEGRYFDENRLVRTNGKTVVLKGGAESVAVRGGPSDYAPHMK